MLHKVWPVILATIGAGIRDASNDGDNTCQTRLFFHSSP